jgi:hypothetical protein
MRYIIHDFEKLASCTHVDDIGSVLDELEIENDIVQRTNVLRKFMGINQSFAISDDEFTPAQEYGIAKRQLIMMNETTNKH